MEQLESFTISGLTLIFRGEEFTIEGSQKLDPLCVHVIVVGQVFCFLGGKTEINGVLMNTADEIISALPVIPPFED